MRSVQNRRNRSSERTETRIHRICICSKKQTLCGTGNSGRTEKQLSGEIQAAGVFVNESVEKIAELLNDHIIDIAQLHGDEDEDYIKRLRQLTGKPIIKAFQVKSEKEIADARQCSADYILLDSGAGTGTVFDWNILKK